MREKRMSFAGLARNKVFLALLMALGLLGIVLAVIDGDWGSGAGGVAAFTIGAALWSEAHES